MALVDIAKETIIALESDDREAASSHLADDFTYSGMGARRLDKQEFLSLMHQLTMAIPDWSFHISDIRKVDNVVYLKTHVTGTQMNELDLNFMDLPIVQGEDTAIRMPEETVELVFKGGKIVQMNVEPVPGGGLPGLYKQLGVDIAVPV